jgi:hypothetical protein
MSMTSARFDVAAAEVENEGSAWGCAGESGGLSRIVRGPMPRRLV